MSGEVEGINPACVCTKDGQLRVGGVYDYQEILPSTMLRVIIIADLSDEDMTRLELQIIKTNRGHEGAIGNKFSFTCDKLKPGRNGVHTPIGKFHEPGALLGGGKK